MSVIQAKRFTLDEYHKLGELVFFLSFFPDLLLDLSRVFPPRL